MKDVHGLQNFVSTHSEESDSVPFVLCLQYQMLFTSTFSKQNSVISFEEWVLVLKLFTGGRNSSVGSAWARCPQRHGFDPPLGTFSGRGDFLLELTWVQTPFPTKLFRMRV